MESRENQKKCRTNKGILKPGIMILISALGCFFSEQIDEVLGEELNVEKLQDRAFG